jgi:hypothetical protein
MGLGQTVIIDADGKKTKSKIGGHPGFPARAVTRIL